MRVFDIYKHPRYGTQAVRRGFSWFAFLLPSVWAVRRGLGYMTVVLVVTTTLMFDIVQVGGDWIQHPVIQFALLALLVVLFGLSPGFRGYRWHARSLQEEDFHFTCTVLAENRRQAIKASNDDHFARNVKIASD
jgi:hypothetical protein